MPTKNRRINMVLDDAMFEAIEELASKRGASRSTVARELLIDALEMQEDIGLGQVAAEREADYEPDTAVSHDDLWTAG
jgi:metal-responsive CopG/Arc/MetJ family transcriptional regulator